MAIEIQPATPERWKELADLFERRGPHGGKPVTLGCWCMYWRLPAKDFTQSWGADNQAALRERVAADSPPGLLAYVDGTAVGWCSLGPREEFVRLERSSALKRVDDRPVWSIVCFYVQADRRRQGVGTALLETAVAHAASGGADVVEAYGCRASDTDPFTGHCTMFREAGFDDVENRGRRTIMRRHVA